MAAIICVPIAPERNPAERSRKTDTLGTGSARATQGGTEKEPRMTDAPHIQRGSGRSFNKARERVGTFTSRVLRSSGSAEPQLATATDTPSPGGLAPVADIPKTLVASKLGFWFLRLEGGDSSAGARERADLDEKRPAPHLDVNDVPEAPVLVALEKWVGRSFGSQIGWRPHFPWRSPATSSRAGRTCGWSSGVWSGPSASSPRHQVHARAA